jgi:hypothetical protein
VGPKTTVEQEPRDPREGQVEVDEQEYPALPREFTAASCRSVEEAAFQVYTAGCLSFMLLIGTDHPGIDYEPGQDQQRRPEARQEQPLVPSELADDQAEAEG